MEFRFEPIGFVKSGGGTYPQEAPRQAAFASNEGVIELLPGRNFEQALEDLAGFERIWLVFVFDRNRNWKPKVLPPDGSSRKRGVFATRSPHRPNPVGLSAVELLRIEGRSVHIRNFDLLDGTPILDIKPYIPEADAFPASRSGWRGEAAQTLREVQFTPKRPELPNGFSLTAAPTWPMRPAYSSARACPIRNGSGWSGSTNGAPCSPSAPGGSSSKRRRRPASSRSRPATRPGSCGRKRRTRTATKHSTAFIRRAVFPNRLETGPEAISSLKEQILEHAEIFVDGAFPFHKTFGGGDDEQRPAAAPAPLRGRRRERIEPVTPREHHKPGNVKRL